MTTTKTLPQRIREALIRAFGAAPETFVPGSPGADLAAAILSALSSPEDAREKALERINRWFAARNFLPGTEAYDVWLEARTALSSPSRSPETTPTDEAMRTTLTETAAPQPKAIGMRAPETTEGPARRCGLCGNPNPGTSDPCDPCSRAIVGAPSGEGTAAPASDESRPLDRCPATPDGRLPADEIGACEFCAGTRYCSGDEDPPPELAPVETVDPKEDHDA